jgi:hypothetical protein
VVIAGLVVVAIELGFPDLVGDGGALRGGPSGGIEASGFEDDPGALRPKRVEVSVSGDLLVHSPVWQNAPSARWRKLLRLPPMMHPIKPFVAGADLAICHLETTLTRGEPQGFPLFATPAALADAIKATGNSVVPNAEQRTLARALTRAPEVTAVVGQGPHVVEPIGRMSGKPVVFSEGKLSIRRPRVARPVARTG